MFTLHPRLAKDSFLIGDFPLSTCRLVNTMQFPWLLLVPRIDNVSEIYQLSAEDQTQFLRESSWLSSQMSKIFRADKMNIAALGNQVAQLHFHHIVRYENDIAWPEPVWGIQRIEYNNDSLDKMRQALMLALRGQSGMPFNWQMS